MKLPLRPLCLFAALALLSPWAAAEPAEDCRQMAEEESVPEEDLDDYIAECIAMMESDYPEDAEEYIPDLEDPDASEALPQD